MMGRMLRLLTAGESHGPGLAVILEGLPAGVPVDRSSIAGELARRRHGYGRGGRQRFEADAFEIQAGVRHGRTLGSPVAITIPNVEYETKYRELMSPRRRDGSGAAVDAAAAGHADLVGTLKYGFDDVRNVLERASARETAARVAAGVLCKSFLAALDVRVFSHVVQIGKVRARRSAPPTPEDLRMIDASPVRCADAATGKAMMQEIDRRRKAKDSVGGVFEVLAYGVPAGLGSYVQWDRKLDARLAAALMSIQSVKGVEIGDGFATAARPGSKAHDEIVIRGGRLTRASARAGGIEGGMSTGQPIRARAAMKPFSTMPQPLRTVDLDTGAPAQAIKQRTDACAVPAGGVVGEAVVAFTLADAALEKFGGDSLPETARNLSAYLERLP